LILLWTILDTGSENEVFANGTTNTFFDTVINDDSLIEINMPQNTKFYEANYSGWFLWGFWYDGLNGSVCRGG